MTTLREAIAISEATRWKGTRSHKTALSQATRAVECLEALGVFTVGDVEPHHVARLAREWKGQGLSASTINHRIKHLKGFGVECRGVKQDRSKKWWLSPDDLERIRTATKALATVDRHWNRFVAFLAWTTHTGLRIEESLRLQVEDIMQGPDGHWELRVRGTKTDAAARPIALSAEATATIRPYVLGQEPHRMAWGFSYQQLHDRWARARSVMGWTGTQGATLKALRRSAARNLTKGGMPTAVLREYLGHENIKTTEGYLRLVGGFTTQEQRRWL